MLRKCPICKLEFENSDFLPFCSLRCKNVDLNKWFNEKYGVSLKNIDDNTRQDEKNPLYD